MRVILSLDTSGIADASAIAGSSQLTIAGCSLCDEKELFFEEPPDFDDLVCEACLRSGTKEAANRAFDSVADLRALAEEIEELGIQLRQGRLRIDDGGPVGKLVLVEKG